MKLSRDERRDEQGVVVTWLVQILLVIAVVGIVLFDAGSIAWNYFSVDSTADEIALDVAGSITESRSGIQPVLIQREARRLARESGVRLIGPVTVTGDSVEVRIRREADTIVVGRVGAIADWAEATATGSAPTS